MEKFVFRLPLLRDQLASVWVMLAKNIKLLQNIRIIKPSGEKYILNNSQRDNRCEKQFFTSRKKVCVAASA